VLAGRGQGRPRRLIAADPDEEPLYVTEPGSVVGIDGGRVTVKKYREKLLDVRLIDVLHVAAYGNVQVTAQCMRTFFDRDVPVFHFSYGGWLQGVSQGLPAKNVSLRMKQLGAAARGDLAAPRRMIAAKIRNSRVLLRRNGDSLTRVVAQLGALAGPAEHADSAPSLLGIEGTAARLYFEALPSLLSPAAEKLPGPAFTGLRNRRPPMDAVNCLLSFCYALLTKELLAACMIVGFDPYVGLLHRPRFGRPALALDLAEEFRPLVADSVVLTRQQRGSQPVGLCRPRRRRGTDGRRASHGDPSVGTKDGHNHAAPGVRISGHVPARCGTPGPDSRCVPARRTGRIRAAGHALMARRRFLVAYDIRDDKRLRAVAGCMEGYGTRIQYSVFICDLSAKEKVLMRGDIETVMRRSEDSVMIVDLGAAGDASRFVFLGCHEELPPSGAVVL
jgi:CRISPR-associated endonuclease Cas1/CRISPR-associated endonuclease Cas2